MTAEQLQLGDEPHDTPPETQPTHRITIGGGQITIHGPDRPPAPPCTLCGRPRRWLHSRDDWAPYCHGNGCTSTTRICQSCRTTYDRAAPGVGTKYCSDACKLTGYAGPRKPRPACHWCGKEAPDGKRPAGEGPYICAACTFPIKHLLPRLRHHHVPVTMWRRLLTDPGCAVCGIDIVTKRTDPLTSHYAALLVVDHDHSCCPGPKACGNCIRGFVCGRCNTTLGFAQDNPDTLRHMADYIDAWNHRATLDA